MKVLLIHPPTSSKYAEPPLGIAYIAAYARRFGHDVHLIDMDPAGLTAGDLPAELARLEPDVVGVSFMTPQEPYAREIFAAVKRAAPSVVTVAGGPHASALPEDVLNIPGCDLVVKGEGEQTFVELLDALAAGGDLAAVDGLIWRGAEGQAVFNAPRALIADLDDLPAPAWDLLGRYRYTDRPVYLRREVEVFPLFTARGCPFKCLFCEEGLIWKRKVRYRRIPAVLDEVEFLYRQRGARSFNVLDDTFTLKPSRVREFCQGLIDRGLEIDWRCTAKATTVTPEMLSDMARSGCKLIAYGVESGNQQILDNIHKKQTLQQVRDAIAMTRRAGMLSLALCIVGNLGETHETVDDTIRFLDETRPDFASCAIITPYPGSGMHRICTENGWLRNDNWADWVPTPHGIAGYRPVTVIAEMDQDDLLEAYYRVNAAILRSRFRNRYGRLYMFSPAFFRREVFRRVRVAGLGHFVRNVWRLAGPARRSA